MVHHKRRYCVGQVETLEELAGKLTESTWTLCTGFECDGLLYLNDSFSEDGAQEYAVLVPGNGHHVQIETITVSWSTKNRLLEIIRTMDRENPPMRYRFIPRLDTLNDHGTCRFCA